MSNSHKVRRHRTSKSPEHDARYLPEQTVPYYDNDNDKPIKSLLKGKGLLPPVGLARLDILYAS
jgi:hypothetical protein